MERVCSSHGFYSWVIINFVSCYYVLSFRTNMKYVNKMMDRLEKEESAKNDEIPSVLEKLLKVDRNIAAVMSLDMMIAGIDTVEFSKKFRTT